MGYTCTDTEPAGSSNTPILSSFLLTRHALLSILQHLAPISLQRLIRCNHCQVKINSHCFRNRMSEFPTSRVRKMVCVRNSVARAVCVCACAGMFSLSLSCVCSCVQAVCVCVCVCVCRPRSRVRHTQSLQPDAAAAARIFIFPSHTLLPLRRRVALFLSRFRVAGAGCVAVDAGICSAPARRRAGPAVAFPAPAARGPSEGRFQCSPAVRRGGGKAKRGGGAGRGAGQGGGRRCAPARRRLSPRPPRGAAKSMLPPGRAGAPLEPPARLAPQPAVAAASWRRVGRGMGRLTAAATPAARRSQPPAAAAVMLPRQAGGVCQCVTHAV
jgi:hypothetical protein